MESGVHLSKCKVYTVPHIRAVYECVHKHRYGCGVSSNCRHSKWGPFSKGDSVGRYRGAVGRSLTNVGAWGGSLCYRQLNHAVRTQEGMHNTTVTLKQSYKSVLTL